MEYNGFKIEKNEWGWYEATHLTDCEAPMLWAKTIEQLKVEIDEYIIN